MVEDPLGHSASLLPPWELDYSAQCHSDDAAAEGAEAKCIAACGSAEAMAEALCAEAAVASCAAATRLPRTAHSTAPCAATR